MKPPNPRAFVRSVFPRAVCRKNSVRRLWFVLSSNRFPPIRIDIGRLTQAEAWQRAAETLRQEMKRG